MADEKFLIEIILEARNRASEALKSVGVDVDNLQKNLKGAEKTVDSFDRHLSQLDGVADSDCPRGVDHQQRVVGHADGVAGHGDEARDAVGGAVDFDGDVRLVPAHGVVVRGLSGTQRELAAGLPLFWSAARQFLYGKAGVLPRKLY